MAITEVVNVNTKEIGRVRNVVFAALLIAGPAALADQAGSEQALRAAIEQFGVDSQTAARAAEEAKTRIDMAKSAEDMASAAKVPAHLLIDLGY